MGRGPSPLDRSPPVHDGAEEDQKCMHACGLLYDVAGDSSRWLLLRDTGGIDVMRAVFNIGRQLRGDAVLVDLPVRVDFRFMSVSTCRWLSSR